MPLKAKADRMTDSTSTGTARGSETFGTRAMPTASMTSAIGSMTQKIPRHVVTARMSPATIGPIAGAIDITIDTRPIMRPREFIGTRLSTLVIMSGIMAAVPTA